MEKKGIDVNIMERAKYIILETIKETTKEKKNSRGMDAIVQVLEELQIIENTVFTIETSIYAENKILIGRCKFLAEEIFRMYNKKNNLVNDLRNAVCSVLVIQLAIDIYDIVTRKKLPDEKTFYGIYYVKCMLRTFADYETDDGLSDLLFESIISMMIYEYNEQNINKQTFH